METNTSFTEGKILKPLILFAFPGLAGVISAGDVWRGRPAHSGKICFIRRCIRGFGKFSDHDYINKSDQQFRNGNHNFAGTADRKRKKRGRRTNRRNSNCHVCGDRSGHVDHYGCFAPSISQIMNAPEEAFQKTVDYIRICGGGMLVIVAYNLIGCIFRGLGDSKTPLITVAIACVFNIAGDLILCAGFHMGTRGAA